MLAMRLCFGGAGLPHSCLAQALLSTPFTPVRSGLPKPAKGSGASLAFAARKAFRLPTDGKIVIACRWPSHAAVL